MTRPGILALTLTATSLFPAPARAELVFLTTGRSVSVGEYRIDGQRAVLTLHGGGEIVCDVRLIARITPDEVPYPSEVSEASDQPGGPTVTLRGPYEELIGPLAAQHRVDVALVRAVIETESGYRAEARSTKGAQGLMQLMPATARLYDVADPYDPGANLEAGIRHLRALLDRYEVSVALAAYNAGEGAVTRYGGIPPFRETREYVARVLRRAGLDRPRPGQRPGEPTGSAGPRS